MQSGVAWQKQVRDKYNHEGTPPVPHLKLKKAVVRPVSRRLAERIIYKYEWLGTMAQSKYHYGIFFGNYCAGVTCVGDCASGGVNVHKLFGLRTEQTLVLARGACVHWAPNGTNSKLVSWTARLLGTDTPGKVLLAYADTDAGEIGTIYQACNWYCVGRGASTRQWLSPNGRVYDKKKPWDLARNRGGTRAQWVTKLRAAGWREQDSNPKYRYAALLDKEDLRLRSKLEAMSTPYPRRPKITCAGSVEGDAPSDQLGEGGSIPTPAL